MPEGQRHRECKRVLAALLKGKPSECWIKRGLRADRCGRFRGRLAYGEVDCVKTRSERICLLSIYDRKTGRKMYVTICSRKPRRSG